jgi:hypothetical protein
MTELETALVAALHAEAQEAAMTTDTPHEQQILESRLDELDRRTRTRRVVWTVVAVAAAVAVVAVGARALVKPPQAAAPAAPPPLFSSSGFGLPFTVESLPSWLTTQSLTPTSESPEWVTWNRCPDNGSECIGLSFNRYSSVDRDRRTAVSYVDYVVYLDQLRRAGKVTIDGRRDTRVDGLPAVVLDVTARSDIAGGVGCHQLAFTECDDFYADVPGRYAVVDTSGLDPSGAVFVVWTRAGAVGAPEQGWQQQFDQMLTTLRFTRAASPSPSG